MDSTVETPINSRQWWEDYFSAQWDANGGRNQSKYFMQRLVESLPPTEREYLASHDAAVLDWGCAFGDGAGVLAETFPRCRIAGLDFAERAVAEARRSFPLLDFLHTPDGSIPDRYDAIVCSHCLEHFDDPLEVLREHLRSCRGFYALLVPYKEAPLHPTHRTQFHRGYFPDRVEGFTRVASEVVDADGRHWVGQMLLVVYASGSYSRDRDSRALQIGERAKWDDYYSTLPMLEIDDAMRNFGEDLAERIGELLPDGGKVLEAGCGAGWQSLALAETGRFQVSLMDFSTEAIAYAERIFAKRNLPAEFADGDVFSPGEPKYDLVFNAGVLEHYTFEQQVAFLRGMASRSTKYVLALVPNRMCYWYWLWRMHRSARGNWPFGKEMPAADMSAAFEAAGLRFLGHWFGGSTWSEFFIKDIGGIDARLREEIMTVHCSQVVPEKQRAYLVAALGCKGGEATVPDCWETSDGSNDFNLDRLAAALADSLAATIAAEHRCRQFSDLAAENEQRYTAVKNECCSLAARVERQTAAIDRLEAELTQAAADSKAAREPAVWKWIRGIKVLPHFGKVRALLAPPGSRRADLADTAVKPLRRAAAIAPRAWRSLLRQGKDAVVRLIPEDSIRERFAQRTLETARRLRRRSNGRPGVDLNQVFAEIGDCKGVVVYPPFIDWGWMRQRPHQLMAQFAEAGYLALFCSPRRRTDAFDGFVRVDERLYLCDGLDPLVRLPNPILLVNRTGHWHTIKRFRSPLVIYDYLDDLSVSTRGGVPNRRKLDLHRKLITRSDIVLATARRLFDEVSPLRPDALYCPNGVDYAHFCLSSSPPIPADMADLTGAGRPIIGYFGALARWFDYDLLAEVARLRGDVSFVLIGPDFDGSMSSSRLGELPNVRWLGEKPYEELPAYLHHFSAAAIPFVVNEITAATSPVKLFEYMAGGKPVVTTDMPECRRHANVLVAGDAGEFAAMLDEAVRRGNSASFCDELRAQARENTWRRRAEQIIERLEAVVEKRKSA